MSRNVAESVRRNPVPALMAVAGTLWLIASTVRGRNTYEYEAEAEDDYDYGRPRRLRRRVSKARDRFRDTSEAATDKVVDRAERVRDTVRDAARARTEQMSERMHTVMEEQPLVMGALAVALGAIIGAVLPGTPYEDRTVGQVRDRTLAKAKAAGEKQYDDLRSKLAHEATHTTGRVN